MKIELIKYWQRIIHSAQSDQVKEHLDKETSGKRQPGRTVRSSWSERRTGGIIRAAYSDSFVIVRRPFVTLHEDGSRAIWTHSPVSRYKCARHMEIRNTCVHIPRFRATIQTRRVPKVLCQLYKCDAERYALIKAQNIYRPPVNIVKAPREEARARLK